MLCYCIRPGDESGMLVYRKGLPFGQLVTWWEFDNSSVRAPKAYINGVEVCPSHSTDHIIPYDVVTNSEKRELPDGSVSYLFTMAISSLDGVDVSCVFRCWSNDDYEKINFNPSAARKSFDETAPERKAEVFGTFSTVAQFELVQKPDFSWELKSI